MVSDYKLRKNKKYIDNARKDDNFKFDNDQELIESVDELSSFRSKFTLLEQ